ncbi:hypothetical protein PRK78_003901 [Emydomyces testavorans]|uniref:C2H2-type domain-containing protein n=1 Tax=Emydomyces testavorans TaxID=2070801 RepID=A0AAF0DHQ5_9EURO|nr:hypothetical protein PRK78_003901 [Emydomyces testavorans]
MLDLEFPQGHSHSHGLLMDSMLRRAPNSLKVNEQTSFGDYTDFTSEASSYLTHPFFVSDIPQPLSKGQLYSVSSASPSLSASQPELLSSANSVSTCSIGSATSSCTGSPYQAPWPEMNPGSGFEQSAIVDDRSYPQDYLSAGIDTETLFPQDKLPDCFVDPALIQRIEEPVNYHLPVIPYQGDPQFCFLTSSAFPPTPCVASPAVANRQSPQQQKRKAGSSPHPQESRSLTRRSSISSIRSRPSIPSPQPSNVGIEEECNEKGRCPHPKCGKTFKDLKAHMLTHQSERPEKCPIVNCEYHLKGFARKYDKNRHTLTHYKGTMVCGFCPGSGSAAEKSFNRADVFKRHLTSVHGVDQSAPNGRKKSPPNASIGESSNYCQDATGKCSTCTMTFTNAQDFYEHLDDCVLRVVQQEEPSEAINMRRLAEVASDEAVMQTMKRHLLVDLTQDSGDLLNNKDNEHETRDESSVKSNGGKGLTKTNVVSRFLPPNPGGVSKSRPSFSRRRNNRNHYPPSWGCPTNKMKMKRRLLCLYDGQRRLWKDEMMLDNEFEVRLNLPGGDGMGREAYITDLDVETIKRAEGVLNATDEEKGPWDLADTSHGLLGPAAVPILGNSNDTVDEINIDELMS